MGAAGEFIPLFEEPILAVLARGYKKADAPLPLAELEGEPFLLSGGQSGEIADLLSSHGVTPQVAAACLDDAAILSMVGHGHGVSLLPALATRGHGAGVCCLATEPRLCRTLGIALPCGRKQSEAVRRLIVACKRVAEGFETEE